ncbi:MAG: 3-hydroxyacyl-CoA dehydrogenase NAD-binding domain-containing protein [Bacteroidia bacterium]|nr:3-hydroxyacyl-CoA dehydrogenase NAD-binding domain-containing protein [Bacteroidia bacterium]MDW8134016.1 3-hydroxyacyl-CoA dehydrogenase NAD-binding domain-containing protein [Bacteroidia bacterium]
MIELIKEGEYALLFWKMPRVNVLNPESVGSFHEALEALLTDDTVKGIVISSRNKEFLAGADIQTLQQLMESADERQIYEASWQVQKVFLRLESGGKPAVAAINGSALGGGYELALACHYRVAVAAPQIEIGLPETTLGLMPGGGGTQRLPRKIGIMPALELLLEGRRLNPWEAHKLGLVEVLVEKSDELIEASLRWLHSKPRGSNPWLEPDYSLPGGEVHSQAGRQIFSVTIARLREKTYGNYPGAYHCLCAVYEGLQVPFLEGLRIESRYFAKTLSSRTARAMVNTLFIGRNKLLELPHRPADIAPAAISKVAILGGGMMGRAIAYVCAAAGYETWVKDISETVLEQARRFSHDLVEKALQRQRLSPQQAHQQLSNLHYTLKYEDLSGADLVIEAVFEDRHLKASVYQEVIPFIHPEGILASNTSTLPISSLAESTGIAPRFIGLHFFSPAERMPLLEIIMGKDTSPHTLAWSLDFAKKIGKVPIVVRDSRGFFTSRVFGTYVREGFRMLMEGVPAALIENLARQAGMPVGPLALADEVSISLMYDILRQTEADLGVSLSDDPVSYIGKLFVEELGRPGKKAQAGFYEYPSQGQRKYLWPRLKEYFPSRTVPTSEYSELIDRFLYVQVAESLRIYQEGILQSKTDGNVGSILGWGFAPFTGGVFHFIEWTGEKTFRERAKFLADKYGPRFLVV